jgi:hypothetical protein
LVGEKVCVPEDGNEVDEDDDEGEVVTETSKSLSSYLIHIAGAGIVSPLNVNVLVNPSSSPSPVYATAVITV